MEPGGPLFANGSVTLAVGRDAAACAASCPRLGFAAAGAEAEAEAGLTGGDAVLSNE